GTRLMLNLALHYNAGQEPVILKNVAKEEEISIRYLEQIIIPLKLGKLVKSIRGAGGGYILTHPPSKVKLIEIIEALEGPIALVDCIDDLDYCDRMPRCAAFEVWKEANNLLRDYFSKTTLQDLVKRSQKKNPSKTK
ncbi:MAG: Rrf2 family transcriptional regulator, partial [Candidatus Aminicenantaceae bacterium]